MLSESPSMGTAPTHAGELCFTLFKVRFSLAAVPFKTKSPDGLLIP